MAGASPEVAHGSHIPGRETGDIVEDLRHAQEQKGFISPAEFEVIARRRGLHVKDVHTVASFFPHFRLKPLARADVRVCDDMTCHLHGARQLRESLELRFAGRDAVTLEVYAPEGEPYLSIFHRARWEKGAVRQEVTIRLPRGVLVRGKVTEAPTGKPVAGASVEYVQRRGNNPLYRRDAQAIHEHLKPVGVSGADGAFEMVVLPGPGLEKMRFIHTVVDEVSADPDQVARALA